MTDPGCAEVREHAAELALDILPIQDRAAALDHLEGCRACRLYVHELTVAGDGLLSLLPAAEPPAGFEQRVLDRLVPAATRPRRLSRRGFVVAAAVAGTAWAAGWWLGGSRDHHDTMLESSLTAGGLQIGQAYVYAESPAWAYLAIEQSRPGQVRCTARLRDGRVLQLGSFRLDGGPGHWGGPVPADPHTVAAIELTGPDGTLIATASF